MCYIFKSLKSNRLLNPGDTIAMGVPIFTPYLEMAHLEDYDLHFVEVHAKQENKFQYPDAELEKLLDPKIKAFFVVNPGNPFAVAMSAETIKKIGAVLKKRPDLILLTDDVYGTFVPGFRSLMGAFPKNTIGVYSYSKYFGCTGWRLGTIAVHEDNIFDEMIAKHPEPIKKLLDKRYGGLTLEPRKFAFIDRIVADSRDVALNHTAGLSLPQQVMMTLFSLAELMDEKKDYQKACIGIVKKRVEATIEGLGIEVGENDYFDYYYGLIDFEFWARKYLGDDVVEWMKANVHPLDIVFRLAEDHGIVLLNGSGFAAPDWSVRISFANLDDHVYDDIGPPFLGFLARSPAPVRAVFFSLFLFATGYKVGPQFFRGLKKSALTQVVLTVVFCVTSLLTTVVARRCLATTAGRPQASWPGRSPNPTVIGTASDTIDRLDLPEAEKTRLKNNIPVAYAVSYLVGTGFVVWFLSVGAPRLLRVNLKAESRKLASQMSSVDQSSDRRSLGIQGMEHPCVSPGRCRGGPDSGRFRALREPRARLRGTHPTRCRAH